MALALFPGYRYGIALDGLSYLSIASSYANGDWSGAINSYWSPLYSWIHVPLLAIGIAPFAAATLVAALVAGATTLGLGRLARLLCSDQAAALISLASAPLILAAAEYGVFADLLLTAVLLFMVADLFDPRLGTDRVVTVRAGLLMGAAYLAKLYALPVAVALFAVVCAVAWLRRRRRPVPVGSLVLTFSTFLLVALPWVALVSLNQGRLTPGTSGSHNLELVSPGSEGTPIRYGGLMAPGNEGAFSAWEDPTDMHVATTGWSKAGGKASVRRELDNIDRNRRDWFGAIWDQGAVLVLAALAGLVVGRRRIATRWPVALGLAAAVGVYSAGYLLTVVEPRYAWFVLLVLAVPGALVFDRLRTVRHGLWLSAAAALVIFASLLPHAVDELQLKWNSGRELNGILTAVSRAEVVPPGSIVASGDNWQRSAIFCFRLDCTYLGQPQQSTGPAERAELRARDVQFYLAWDVGTGVPPGARLLQDPATTGGLRIYRVGP